MKLNRILPIVYLVLILLVVISIFNVSVVDKVDPEYFNDYSDYGMTGNDLSSTIRAVKIYSYIIVYILIFVGLILSFINKRVISIISIVILIIASALFAFKSLTIDSKIIMEGAGEDSYIVRPEVELMTYKKTHEGFDSIFEYMENLGDILQN